MASTVFASRTPNIIGNPLLRLPQVAAYEKLVEAAATDERELGVVLPVGCGKSGVIAIAPFAFKARRTLVVAPGLRIASQLEDDLNPSKPSDFHIRCAVLEGGPYPEPASIRGEKTIREDLEEAEIVVTNIGQLQGEGNRWLAQLPPDFFDLIQFDEAHHNIAESWEVLRAAFPAARILNFSATPLRADGRPMAGKIIYSFPVADAIRAGYVKTLKAIRLNPQSLRYVREEDGREIEVSLDEVIRLGDEDSDFRRSIVTSAATRDTIVGASIRELEKLRRETGERKLKIIASALNYKHCIQIVEAYRAAGMRANYVHSKEVSATNRRVFERLANHDLDVIVQVRQLGEGFDHPYLSVAAVFSVFRSLSPFVQFVGRVMRTIDRDNPDSPLNCGTVVFHAGANIAQRWADFREFSEADQEYFAQLLPMEGLDFTNADEISGEPDLTRVESTMEVRSGGPVLLQEIPLLASDPEVRRAFELLRDRGMTVEEFGRALELTPVPTTRQQERIAARASLDDQVKNEVGRVLKQRGLNPKGRDLDKGPRRRENFVILKSAIDRRIAGLVGRKVGERAEFARSDLQRVEQELDRLVAESVREVVDGEV